MSDVYSFTPPTINTSALAFGTSQTRKVENTESVSVVSTSALNYIGATSSISNDSGYVRFVHTGSPAPAEGDIILFNKSGDPSTKLNGYHMVRDFAGHTGTLFTPWESCFTGIIATNLNLYHTRGIYVSNNALHHFSSQVPDTLRRESIHSLPVITTTVYTNDYNAFHGAPTRCQVSTTQDNMGTDTELTDPKVHISNGVKVFTYDIDN